MKPLETHHKLIVYPLAGALIFLLGALCTRILIGA